MISGPSRERDADSSQAPIGRSFSFAGTGLSLNRFAANDFYRWFGGADQQNQNVPPLGI
jgi:hypothetical protein